MLRALVSMHGAVVAQRPVYRRKSSSPQGLAAATPTHSPVCRDRRHPAGPARLSCLAPASHKPAAAPEAGQRHWERRPDLSPLRDRMALALQPSQAAWRARPDAAVSTSGRAGLAPLSALSGGGAAAGAATRSRRPALLPAVVCQALPVGSDGRAGTQPMSVRTPGVVGGVPTPQRAAAARPPAPQPPAQQPLSLAGAPPELRATMRGVYQQAAALREETGEEVEAVDAQELKRRAKISAANKGRTPWNKGRKHPPEVIARIREATRKAMQRPDVQRRLAAANQKREPHTDEAKVSAGPRHRRAAHVSEPPPRRRLLLLPAAGRLPGPPLNPPPPSPPRPLYRPPAGEDPRQAAGTRGQGARGDQPAGGCWLGRRHQRAPPVVQAATASAGRGRTQQASCAAPAACTRRAPPPPALTPLPPAPAPLPAQAAIVLARMAASEDAVLRECAEYEKAQEVIAGLAWQFFKKDWNQVRWVLVGLRGALPHAAARRGCAAAAAATQPCPLLPICARRGLTAAPLCSPRALVCGRCPPPAGRRAPSSGAAASPSCRGWWTASGARPRPKRCAAPPTGPLQPSRAA